MKLWTLNKYWVAFGVVSFLTNLVSLGFGVNVLLSLFVLGVFGFGCILAVASLYKLVNKTVNPSAVQTQLTIPKQMLSNELMPVIYMTDKDIKRFQIHPEAPFWLVAQRLQGGESKK
jgi:hypothetical protein